MRERQIARHSASSGGGGIRTLGTLARTPVFETGPFNRSGTPPRARTRGTAEGTYPACPGDCRRSYGLGARFVAPWRDGACDRFAIESVLGVLGVPSRACARHRL